MRAEPDPSVARRARKREARRFTAGARRRRWVVAAAAVLTLFVVTPMVLAMSPLFAVRSVQIDGATPSVERELQVRLAPVIGTPIALVDDSALRRAITGVVDVATYTVADLPPDRIAVRIVQRVPVGQVRSAGEYRVVDAAGVVLRTSSARVGGLPVVSTADAAAFAAVSAVLAGMPAALRAETRTASAASADDVRLVLTDGKRVVWGSPADGAAKAGALQAALVRAAKHASVIDVSAPGVVAVR